MELNITLPARFDRASLEAFKRSLDRALPGQTIVLTGGKDMFCGGLDFHAAIAGEMSVADGMRLYADCVYALRAHSGPCIAIIEGDAFGGGVGLFATCDYVIAGPETRFGLPEALYGFYPAIVFAALSERVAPTLARQWALQCESIDTAAALSAHLIDEIASEPTTRLPRILRRFGRALPEAVAAIRANPAHLSAFRQALDASVAETLILLDRPEVRARLKEAVT
ncbi:enoyl-CoA hydratase/isomerase family protein [Asticcacaulis sp. BYS171W]|uniref:Enoyl-CoA hydratase/isomerase family protein n=1 Tax=Asticcacaulis aquaticus TaxID=2984212 RepID=A0ABT5HWC6_9CAUL|nr:enoyl-CoA hydratase/isomerase family protein [Asticcacaulis aquaticus]MDC7683736.1 enoyl-CoA hydratase/isomerase family protein [Asticcacaulis aquaticus]